MKPKVEDSSTHDAPRPSDSRPSSTAEMRLTDIRAIVGTNVRRIRRARGWTQAELIRRFGATGLNFMVLSRPTIVALEKGRRGIDVNELLALGLVLGVAPHLLLY